MKDIGTGVDYYFEENIDDSSFYKTGNRRTALYTVGKDTQQLLSFIYEQPDTTEMTIPCFHVNVGPSIRRVGYHFSSTASAITGIGTALSALCTRLGETVYTGAENMIGRILTSGWQPTFMAHTHWALNVVNDLRYCNVHISPSLCNYRNWQVGCPNNQATSNNNGTTVSESAFLFNNISNNNVPIFFADEQLFYQHPKYNTGAKVTVANKPSSVTFTQTSCTATKVVYTITAHWNSSSNWYKLDHGTYDAGYGIIGVEPHSGTGYGDYIVNIRRGVVNSFQSETAIVCMNATQYDTSNISGPFGLAITVNTPLPDAGTSSTFTVHTSASTTTSYIPTYHYKLNSGNTQLGQTAPTSQGKRVTITSYDVVKGSSEYTQTVTYTEEIISADTITYGNGSVYTFAYNDNGMFYNRLKDLLTFATSETTVTMDGYTSVGRTYRVARTTSSGGYIIPGSANMMTGPYYYYIPNSNYEVVSISNVSVALSSSTTTANCPVIYVCKGQTDASAMRPTVADHQHAPTTITINNNTQYGYALNTNYTGTKSSALPKRSSSL